LEKIAYVTHSDKNYLSRALALIASMRERKAADDIFLFCNDDWSYEKIQSCSDLNIRTIKTNELRVEYPELEQAFNDRSILEFYYCISPFVVRYLIDKGYECVVYLDSDLFFYENPTPLISNLAAYDLGIVPHNFKPEHIDLEKYGKFNVGMMFFRNTVSSLKTLSWWQTSCLESTSSQLTKNSYADQKYLDRFPSMGSKLYIFEDEGLNAAPWNCYRLTSQDQDSYYLTSSRVFYFHYSGLRIYNRFATLGFTTYRYRPNTIMKKMYSQYIREVLYWENVLGNPNRRDYRKRRFLDFAFAFKYSDFVLIQ
jgi:hypothetical protein